MYLTHLITSLVNFWTNKFLPLIVYVSKYLLFEHLLSNAIVKPTLKTTKSSIHHDIEFISQGCLRNKLFKGTIQDCGNSQPYVCSPGLLSHLRAPSNGTCHNYCSINTLVTGNKIDLSTSLKFLMLLPLSRTQVSFSAAQMRLAMTSSGPTGSTIDNKWGPSGNLH